MLRFLEADESLNMQAVNRFLYEIAIGRVCTTCTLNQPLFPSIQRHLRIGAPKSNGTEVSLDIVLQLHD